MAVNLGASAVSLKLGSQSVVGFLGSQIVTASVPGAPTITSFLFLSESIAVIGHAIPDNGGSPITTYRVFINGGAGVDVEEFEIEGQLLAANISAGDSIQIAAVNAVGEGPKSASFTVTA